MATQLYRFAMFAVFCIPGFAVLWADLQTILGQSQDNLGAGLRINLKTISLNSPPESLLRFSTTAPYMLKFCSQHMN